MSGQDGKTEKATPERRRKARKEGQIARSAEIGVAVSLAVVGLVLKVFAAPAFRVLQKEMSLIFSAAGTDSIPTAMLGASFLRMAGVALGPFLAAGMLAAILSGVMQTGGAVSTKAAKPKLSHINPKSGLKRFKPAQSGWDLFRSIAKLGLLFAFIWGPMSTFHSSVTTHRELGEVIGRTLDLGWTIMIRAILLMGIIGAADYFYARFRLAKELRMTKQEIKEEHKQSEGDPHVKGQRRRRAMEMTRNRMLGDVATADVVITNPTHFAVALRYADGDPAPRVVAKGADKIAAKIRAEAYRNGVLVTRDVPLARALYRRCKVGSFVPAALFEAVAVVLALAYRRYGRIAA